MTLRHFSKLVFVDVLLGSVWTIARIVIYPLAVVSVLLLWPLCEILFGSSHDRD
jgi:hypothetical protein